MRGYAGVQAGADRNFSCGQTPGQRPYAILLVEGPIFQAFSRGSPHVAEGSRFWPDGIILIYPESRRASGILSSGPTPGPPGTPAACNVAG